MTSSSTKVLSSKAVKRRAYFKRSWILYAMLLVPTAWYLLFCYLPMYGIQIAFKNYNLFLGIQDSAWAGFVHFKSFLQDERFWQVLRNTFFIGTGNLLVNFTMPVILALFFNQMRDTKFKKGVQSVSYIPHFISSVAIINIMSNFLSLNGPINKAVEIMGGESVEFLASEGWFIPIYIFIFLWKDVGWGTIIYLAAMANIDSELYQAADIDGATTRQKMFRITIPCILPTIAVMLILAMPGILGADFDTVLLLQNNANMGIADVIGTYTYRRGLIDLKYDYSAAVGLFFAVISIIIIFASNKIAKKLGDVSLW